MKGLAAGWRTVVGWTRRLLGSDAQDQVVRLTLLLLIFHAPGNALSHLPYLVLAVGEWRRPGLLRSPAAWLVAGLWTAAVLAGRWYSADNHKYLMVYWCLALALSLSAPEGQRGRILAINARLLLGLCMAFALGWKLANRSFLDASFLDYTLRTNKHFLYAARWLAGVPPETYRLNAARLHALVVAYIHGVDLRAVPLLGPAWLHGVAVAMTWWTLLIEAALALAFFWPSGRFARVTRNGLLLVFLATTYLLATVLPFAFLLVVLGMAQCPEGPRGLRRAYLAALVLVHLYALPHGGRIEWVGSHL
jgi:hypothetical protein